MIHVVGQGPIGLLIASQLIDSGQATQMVVKKPDAPATRRFTRVTAIDGLAQAPETYQIACQSWAQLSENSIDLAILCTKAQDAQTAYQQVALRLKPDGWVLFLNNGMGPQQAALQGNPNQVLLGTNSQGAYFRPSSAELVFAGQGRVAVGSPRIAVRPQRLPALFSWHPDIDRLLWEKLAVNALINPLTLLFQCQNGDLLARPEARQQLADLASEVDAIAASVGQQALRSEQRAVQTAEATARNWSSTLQDFRAGRTNELDYILGYLIATAQDTGVACPVLRRTFDNAVRLASRQKPATTVTIDNGNAF